MPNTETPNAIAMNIAPARTRAARRGHGHQTQSVHAPRIQTAQAHQGTSGEATKVAGARATNAHNAAAP